MSGPTPMSPGTEPGGATSVSGMAGPVPPGPLNTGTTPEVWQGQEGHL